MKRSAESTLPRWVFVVAVLGAAFVLLPLVAMTTRVDWLRFGELITSESSQAAFWLSLQTSGASTLLCLILGVPMALVLARTRFRSEERRVGKEC